MFFLEGLQHLILKILNAEENNSNYSQKMITLWYFSVQTVS